MYRPIAESDPVRVTVSEARRTFADLVNRVAYGNARVTVARHGRDLVAIVPMGDMQQLASIWADRAHDARPVPVAAQSRTPRRTDKGPRA